MKLRFITPATTAHVRQSTARTITVARKAGSLSFSAALVRELGLSTTGPGATLTEDADAPGSWYALFGSTEPAHDSRPLRGKSAEKDRKETQGLNFINTPLARAVLDSHQVPADTNRLVLQVLPEPVEFEGMVLWPLRVGAQPSAVPAKAATPAKVPATPAPTLPAKPEAPALSPVAAGPSRPVASIADASDARLEQRHEHLLESSKPLTGKEVAELSALRSELQKRGVLELASEPY
ncbi:hypothetical protein D0N36_06835 [Hymenobacter lapidiphilus]|uniref:hypothetical protein n=1 Tax=Hymenobacter sp. CCM 8763 TaxID=2303334 RepID=UPI000E3559A1|nr:hypothetical protein [Hymenobacter sp. CCM 8763]RFP65913.1 hypothetical protein D0N36_06835 [Hymenobacter sp. CCM 8763]